MSTPTPPLSFSAPYGPRRFTAATMALSSTPTPPPLPCKLSASVASTSGTKRGASWFLFLLGLNLCFSLHVYMSFHVFFFHVCM
ncbi:hypothetical protein LguiB_001293 [Lonicera macranthoides]